MPWPARIPDFFLWGHLLKSVIYAKKPVDIPEIKTMITDEIPAITPEKCHKPIVRAPS
jgi:hypothetical protein